MPDKKIARAALKQVENDFLGRRNVVGLGIRAAGPSSGGQALAVYVSHKVPLDALAEADRIPNEIVVETRNGPITVPTVVLEIGAMKPE